MEYLILSGIGAVLLYGLFHVVPLKLNRQLKFVYVFFSIILANVFLLIQSILKIWQSVLILFLLICLVFYFLTKKQLITNTLQKKAVVKVAEDIEMENLAEREISSALDKKDKLGDEVEDSESFIQQQTALQKEEVTIEIEVEIEWADEEVIANRVSEVLEILEETDDNIDDSIEVIEELIEPEPFNQQEESNEEEIVDESNVDTDFLEERKDILAQLEEESFANEIVHSPEQGKVEVGETILEETDIIDDMLCLGDPEITPKTEIDEVIVEEIAAKVHEIESTNSIDTEAISIEKIEDIDPIKSIEPIEEPIDPIVTVEGDRTEDQQHENVTENLKKEMDEIVAIPPKQLNRDLLDFLVEQLSWYKKRMSQDEYEALVTRHMTGKVADFDYYTFATLLRDYYIETRQFEKLHQLLNELNERFDHKPIIKQEILFFIEMFFENN